MNLSFEVLQALDAIERAGTFASAAEELHKVPSSVTYIVQKLEVDLGIKVFERTGRRATLTRTGQVLVDGGRRLLEAARELEIKIKRIECGCESELRIAMGEIVSLESVWRYVPDFYRENPGTRLHLSTETLGGAWDALIARRADLIVGAAGEPPLIARLAVKKMASVRQVFAVAPIHPLASIQEPLTMDDIADYRAVVVGDTSRRDMPRPASAGTERDVLTVPTLAAKLAAQISGIGVGTLPEHTAIEAIENGQLICKDVQGMSTITPYYLAWRADEAGSGLRWWVEQLETLRLMESR